MTKLSSQEQKEYFMYLGILYALVMSLETALRAYLLDAYGEKFPQFSRL